MTDTLVSPFPIPWSDQLWAWMQEHPLSNIDDYGPSSSDELVKELMQRAEVEQSWGVLQDKVPVGFIGYRPITPDTGMLHGICFSEDVHGTGVTHAALEDVLARLKSDGVRKVSACYFEDNHRVRKFLSRHGFGDEGVLVHQTMRQGSPLSLRLVARFL